MFEPKVNIPVAQTGPCRVSATLRAIRAGQNRELNLPAELFRGTVVADVGTAASNSQKIPLTEAC